jgi:predicted ATPase
VADSLRRTPDASEPLAKLVHLKTNGNPFFVIQFLTSLYQEELLTFDYDLSGWRYDLARIENLEITDNVVDLMVRKIQRLPEETRQIVILAAKAPASLN